MVYGMTTFIGGFYFPIFYLQLDAVKHGINETLSFYAVRVILLPINWSLMDMGSSLVGSQYFLVRAGPPALLSSKFTWWKPALLAGCVPVW